MNLQKITNSRLGTRIGYTLGRILPPKVGYQFSTWIADILSRQKSIALVEAVRINQYVIRNYKIDQQELDEVVKNVFIHAGRCFIDLYHSLGNQERVLGLVSDDEASREFVKLSKDPSFGAFIAIPHISNFDLCLQALAYRGVEGQVLSYGQPTGGYELQNKIRAQTGIEISPIKPASLKRAIKWMKCGGFVFTGVERPIQHSNIYLRFFDRLSSLPTGHIRMAQMANVPIIVASAYMDKENKYHIHFSNPIPVITNTDPDTEIRENGEKILNIIETRIREHPEQWLMYYPVWPDISINN